MLGRFRRHEDVRPRARSLFEAIVGAARNPLFHTRFHVADTVDGRFDLLTLHVFVAMEALKKRGEAGERIGKELATVTFTMFDEALRELGVSDMGMARRIKAMANAFYGRLQAYGAAASDAEMEAALLRNLYRGDGARAAEASVLAHYIQGTRLKLAAPDGGVALMAGDIDFGSVPEL